MSSVGNGPAQPSLRPRLRLSPARSAEDDWPPAHAWHLGSLGEIQTARAGNPSAFNHGTLPVKDLILLVLFSWPIHDPRSSKTRNGVWWTEATALSFRPGRAGRGPSLPCPPAPARHPPQSSSEQLQGSEGLKHRRRTETFRETVAMGQANARP